MDFVDEVRTRSGRFAGRVKYWESKPPTEEATKTSLVLPFIQMLGYDIFDPTEVVPEFTADIGIKRGEKVDYAITQRGKPAILIECKKYGSNLAEDAVSQLVRYFGVTNAHFGILTDGISYRFFSDLDQPNVMDPKPFFEFNLLSCSDKAVEELKRFTKEEFNVDETLEAAAVLKYIEGMKQALVRQLSTPDEEFSRWLTKQVYSKLLTQAARERLSTLSRIHRRTSLGTVLEEARGCSSESGIMVLEQKPARKQGAPNRCCHRTNPTVCASSLTTIAWWPMPACSCRPP